MSANNHKLTARVEELERKVDYMESVIGSLIPMIVPPKQSECPHSWEELCGAVGTQYQCSYCERDSLPRTNTDVTCPNCGSNRYRVVYKDDEGVDLDFYDCLLCPYTWV